jgi:colicin import membrane protein
MGKKSLIKSTSKKKTETKPAPKKTTQKEAAKTAKKAPAKSAQKSSAQAASKAETKADPKTVKTDPAASKSKSKPAPKTRSIKELTFLKFEALTAPAKKIAAPKPETSSPTAPPFINTKDAKEVERLRRLLAKKFNMAEIKAAAKAPAPKPAAVDVPAPEVTAIKTKPRPQITEEPSPKVVTTQPAPKPVEQSAYITVEPTEPGHRDAPVSRSVKIAVSAAALLILIILAVSANNSGKYYIKPIDNAIEIWKGDFSPKDKEFYMVLHGVPAPEPIKDVYSKEEVFPLIFNYYLDKADTLLEVKGLPDFEGIKNYLHQAKNFADTNDMKLAVNDRLNTIERMILLYKADVAISRNTQDSLESAIKILKDAGKLTPSEMQAEEITQKIEAAREKIKTLNTEGAAQSSEK